MAEREGSFSESVEKGARYVLGGLALAAGFFSLFRGDLALAAVEIALGYFVWPKEK